MSGDRERSLWLQVLFIPLKFHVSLTLKGQMRRTPLPTWRQVGTTPITKVSNRNTTLDTRNNFAGNAAPL
jgi:hypothetical protein